MNLTKKSTETFQEKKARMERERKEHNAKVTISYRLKVPTVTKPK